MSCKCKCKLDGTKCNSNQWWDIYKCWCECKTHHICENEKYLAINDSSIMCDEVTAWKGQKRSYFP